MIEFENKLLPITHLTEKEQLPIRIACIINTDERTKPRNSKINPEILIQLMNGMGIPFQDNYYDIIKKIRGLIQGGRGRFCRWLGGYETLEFERDDFMMVTYFEHEGNNYINGFVKVKNCNITDVVRTNYVCTDLYFSAIGKLLITLLKIIVINLRINKVRISSVLRATTQNFYTSQGFYPLPEQRDEGRFVWFEWNFKTLSKKDHVDITKFSKKIATKNFLASFEPSKFTQNRDEHDRSELLPYRLRSRRSPTPSPRHFRSPRSPRRVVTPRSPIEEEEGTMFREVESPKGTARGRKKRKGTKKRRRRKL